MRHAAKCVATNQDLDISGLVIFVNHPDDLPGRVKIENGGNGQSDNKRLMLL
jgi:hypothetical protein